MKQKVSAILICQDEENRIRKCLDSITWADEIVVVDSGSTDKTLEIAAEYTSRIIINSDWQGFGAQKKLAEDNATYDWIFSIDCDEVVNEELKSEILEVLDVADEKNVYQINRLTNFCGQFIKHSGWHPNWIVRLYNKKYYHFNNALVHEKVDSKNAKKVNLKSGYLLHYTFTTLEDYIEKRNGYAKTWAESKYINKRKNVSVTTVLVHAYFAFIKHYFFNLGFLDGYPGFLISMIQFQYTFNKYNYLMLKQKQE